MKMHLIAALPLLAFASMALADEPISTHAGEAVAAEAQPSPIPGPGDDARRANGEWARRVMAGQSTDQAAPADGKGCHRNPDREPHGEVWAGVGSGGYNTVGAVVTEPIGDCAQATIAVSRTDGGNITRGRRR